MQKNRDSLDPGMAWMYVQADDLERNLSAAKEEQLMNPAYDALTEQAHKSSVAETKALGSGKVAGASLLTDEENTGMSTEDKLRQLREDPLYIIKKAETQKLEELVNNPLVRQAVCQTGKLEDLVSRARAPVRQKYVPKKRTAAERQAALEEMETAGEREANLKKIRLELNAKSEALDKEIDERSRESGHTPKFLAQANKQITDTDLSKTLRDKRINNRRDNF